jgi:uncharacterized membrane protein YphA (DoxX/SURF4 family)
MKLRPIAYWITTALTALIFLSGGIGYLIKPAIIRDGIAHLGYPLYITTILAVWKLLGGVTILVPRAPLLKEWAYAGMIFNLTGAVASHAAAGDPLANMINPLLFCGLVIASWALRPASRRLPGTTRSSHASAHPVV